MAEFSDAKSGTYCMCTREKCSDECKTYRRFRPKPITNADRIRAMTDEELARYLNSMQSLAYQNGVDVEPIRLYPNNYCAWLSWLRQGGE